MQRKLNRPRGDTSRAIRYGPSVTNFPTSVLLLLPLLFGCKVIPDQVDLEDELSEPPGPVPGVDSVEPTFGVPGDTVIVNGSNFDQSARVFFGQSEAEVLGGEPTGMRVVVPDGSEAQLDLRVQTDSGEGVLQDAFWRLEDGQGLAGITGFFEYSAYVGGYWGDPPDPTAAFRATLLHPSDFSWEDLYAAGVDQCALNYEFSGDFSVLDAGLDTITMQGQGSQPLTLAWDPKTYFFEVAVADEDFVFDERFDLQTVQPDNYPSFEAQDLLRTPTSTFTVSQPAIEGASAPTIGRSFTMEWSGGSADLLAVTIGRSGSDGGVAEVISCLADYDGSFTVPDLWTDWNEEGVVYLWISALRLADGTLPLNGAHSGMVGMYTKVGAGFAE